MVHNKDIAKFTKIPFDQFKKDMEKLYPRINEFTMGDEDVIWRIWSSIKIPKRSTTGAAGYDFFSPFDFTLHPGESIVIPTGISATFLDNNWILIMKPRSSSVKTRVGLINTLESLTPIII